MRDGQLGWKQRQKNTLLHEGRAMEFRNDNFLAQDSIDIAGKSELPTALYVWVTGEQYSNLMHKKANSLNDVLEYIALKQKFYAL